MIVVDTSALIAVMGCEAGYEALEAIMIAVPQLYVSAPIVLETTQVASRWHDWAALEAVDELLAALSVTIMDLTQVQLKIARQAFLRFGKGRGHPAQLNQMDCFSYALARALDAPLLFKGQDFLHTDVRQALA